MQVRCRFGGSNLRVFLPDGLCVVSKCGQGLDTGGRGKESGHRHRDEQVPRVFKKWGVGVGMRPRVWTGGEWEIKV